MYQGFGFSSADTRGIFIVQLGIGSLEFYGRGTQMEEVRLLSRLLDFDDQWFSRFLHPTAFLLGGPWHLITRGIMKVAILAYSLGDDILCRFRVTGVRLLSSFTVCHSQLLSACSAPDTVRVWHLPLLEFRLWNSQLIVQSVCMYARRLVRTQHACMCMFVLYLGMHACRYNCISFMLLLLCVFVAELHPHKPRQASNSPQHQQPQNETMRGHQYKCLDKFNRGCQSVISWPQ